MLKKILAFFAFGLLVVLAGRLYFDVPGGMGVKSNFAEVALLIAIPFLQKWYYAPLLAVFTIFNSSAEGSVFAESFNHVIGMIFIWFAYKWSKRIINPIKFIVYWFTAVLIYYYLFLIPIIFTYHYISGAISLIAAITTSIDVGKMVVYEVIVTILISCFYFTMFRELDNRKKIQVELELKNKELIKKQSLLLAQYDATKEGILVVSSQGEIISFNTRFCEIWNIPLQLMKESSDEIALTYVRNNFDDPMQFQNLVEKIYEQPELKQTDTLTLTSGKIINRYTAPIKSEDGESFGRVWFFSDITALKNAEKTIEKRTEENEELLKAMTHDLRSPLVNIHNFSGTLLQCVTENDLNGIKESTHYIQKSVSKISSMLDTILQLGRLSRIQKNFQSTSLELIINESERITIEQNPYLNFSLNKSLHNIAIFGNSESLQIAFTHIFNNSIKFKLPSIDPIINITATQNSHQVTISIQDNGIGIDPRFTNNLVNLFEKINPNTPGVGMGLSIVKRIIERHNGTLKIYSEGLGKGTSITIQIPNP